MQNIILLVYIHHLILFFEQSTSLIIPKKLLYTLSTEKNIIFVLDILHEQTTAKVRSKLVG